MEGEPQQTELEQTELDGIKAKLRELEKQRSSGDTWTEENRQELLSLQEKFKPPTISPEEQRRVSWRQTHAGINGEPLLTPDEIATIQQINRRP